MANFTQFTTFPIFSHQSGSFLAKSQNFSLWGGGSYIKLWSCQICHKQGSHGAYGTAVHVEVQSFTEIPLYHSVFYFCHTLVGKDPSGGLLAVFSWSSGGLWQSSGNHQKTARRWSYGSLLAVLVTNRGLPEDHQKTARRPQEDNTEDYEQLKEEYLELREDTKSQPKKNRKKLPKLKMNKNTKKLIRMVNRIIKTTSTDNMNITNINLIQYTGALLITNYDNTCQTNNHFICR